ncbi:acyl carrier protein [Kitasatospora sp. NPDC096077]|uniref:acyl carrier protein n=1 Tax=unclassified Kitasatospora TaxID=2633591 RepID=UPI00332F354D
MTVQPTDTARPADAFDRDLFDAVAALLVEIAEVPAEAITPEARFRDDLDVDSLLMVEFGVSLEDHFEVAIPDDDFIKLLTVGELVAFVQKQRAASA